MKELLDEIRKTIETTKLIQALELRGDSINPAEFTLALDILLNDLEGDENESPLG